MLFMLGVLPLLYREILVVTFTCTRLLEVCRIHTLCPNAYDVEIDGKNVPLMYFYKHCPELASTNNVTFARKMELKK